MKDDIAKTIHPNDMLPIGTQVRVIGRGIGRVSAVSEARDQHNRPISVHYISFSGKEPKPVNYSFVVRPD